MPRTDSGRAGLLELARRQQGPVEVTLYWDRDAARATVVVWNWASGACLQLNTKPEQAKYAFTHPYAYAAAHGVPEQDLLRAA
jgi:hypothetical protein